MSRAEDLLLLMTCGLALGACEPAVDPGDDPDGDPDRDLVDDAVELCRPYAKQVVACYEQQDQGESYAANYITMVGYCVASVGYAEVSGPGCVAAYDDYFACLATLDCADIVVSDEVDYSEDDGGGDSPEPEVYPCEAQEEAIGAACGSPGYEVDDDSD